jgi:hypothetical protein
MSKTIPHWRFGRPQFSLEDESALLDASLFHDDWSGTIEYRFKTRLNAGIFKGGAQTDRTRQTGRLKFPAQKICPRKNAKIKRNFTDGDR